MLPFYGYIKIEYHPGEVILGLSKFNRIVNFYSKKLQTQETLTNEICDFIFNLLKPKNIKVTSVMQHMCISMRKIGNHETETTVIAYKSI
jgi:GTP cyclohydrolase IA